jgi:hypothetical protein
VQAPDDVLVSPRGRLVERSPRCLVTVLCAAASLCFGCPASLTSGIKLEAASIKASPPGRVQAVVTVETTRADASDLSRENFQVREGEVVLDSEQVGLRVQRLGDAKGHQVLIVVDAGKPFTDAETTPLADGLSRLIDRLRFHQTVTLAAYDGSMSLQLVASYPQSQVAKPLRADAGIRRLLRFKPRDDSSSLFTAIVEANRILSARLDAAQSTVEPLGNLIVVARRPDLAGRTDENAARAVVKARRAFLLKVGAWSHDTSLDWIGSHGVRGAASLGTLGTPVDELGRMVDDVFLRSYVVSYCSPARAGKRTLEVVVRVDDDSGAKRQAAATGEFDATGFNASCRASPSVSSAL